MWTARTRAKLPSFLWLAKPPAQRAWEKTTAAKLINSRRKTRLRSRTGHQRRRYINFNRYYFAQVGKLGAVIDERYNHGGQVADYIIDLLGRPLRNCAIAAKVKVLLAARANLWTEDMVINEMSGSGGDALPWMFKQDGLGPLFGTRTWADWSASSATRHCSTAVRHRAPCGIYGLHGEWKWKTMALPRISSGKRSRSVAAGTRATRKSRGSHLEALKKKPVDPDHPPYPKLPTKIAGGADASGQSV